MKRSNIIIISGVVVLIMAVFFYRDKKNDSPAYIYDRTFKIQFNDTAFAADDAKNAGSDDAASGSARKRSEETPKKEIMNYRAFRFLSSLQNKFMHCETLEEQYSKVYEYLLSVMPKEEADEHFKFYKMIRTFEEKFTEKFQGSTLPSDLNEAIGQLRSIKEFQEEYFGTETANVLFGTDMKNTEYGMRRSAILHDNTLDSNKKIEALGKLNNDMWGDEYEQREEKMSSSEKMETALQIYKTDLENMPQEEREKKIDELRAQYLPPEVVKNYQDYFKWLESQPASFPVKKADFYRQ